MTQPDPQAARARALRRKHLQQRQTVIFGSIVAALLALALFAGAIWADILPAPISVPIASPTDETPAALPQPCPPADTPPPTYEDIEADVYNSTSTAGLGATVSDSLRGHGLDVENTENEDDVYPGTALITVGPEGIPAAYALADLIPEAQIKMADRDGAGVDITLGSAFSNLTSEEELTLDPELPIPTPDECYEVDPDDPTANQPDDHGESDADDAGDDADEAADGGDDGGDADEADEE